MFIFSVGQRVIANTSSQGLRQGAPYTVVQVHPQAFPFGTFVAYELSDGTTRYVVRNGHLVLRAAQVHPVGV